MTRPTVEPLKWHKMAAYAIYGRDLDLSGSSAEYVEITRIERIIAKNDPAPQPAQGQWDKGLKGTGVCHACGSHQSLMIVDVELFFGHPPPYWLELQQVAELNNHVVRIEESVARALAAEARLEQAVGHVSELLDAAQWMTGSNDFSPEGQAHRGWLKFRPALERARAFLAQEPIAAMKQEEGRLRRQIDQMIERMEEQLRIARAARVVLALPKKVT